MRKIRLIVIGTALTVVGLAGAAPTAAGILPVAVADSYNIAHDQTRTVAAPGVLANDLQLGGGFTAQLVSDVTHGNLDLNANGSFTYDPDSGYAGSDTFRYRVNGGLLGLSNTATVTLTVAAAPTPTASPTPTSAPTPTPTPAPTPTPTPKPTSTPKPTPTTTPGPTPTPTPRPTSTATPGPTPTPTPRPTTLPTLSPLPTVPPVPTLPPIGSPSPGTTPTGTPSPTPTPRPTADPAAAAAGTPTDPRAGGGPVAPTSGGSGGGDSTPPPAIHEEPFAVNGPDRGGTVELDASSITLVGFEWAVPALVLTVPGLLLIIAVAVETMIGLAWLPVARRWVGRDEHADRRRRRRLSPS
jgi:Bacterial Ig domain